MSAKSAMKVIVIIGSNGSLPIIVHIINLHFASVRIQPDFSFASNFAAPMLVAVFQPPATAHHMAERKPKPAKTQQRKTEIWNGCPIRYFSGLLGDRWSMLVLRDMIFNDARRYGDFLKAPEGIATNILAARLQSLQDAGLILATQHGRHKTYILTEKGRGLIPTMISVIAWGAVHDPQTDVPHAFMDKFRADPDALAAEIAHRIIARDWDVIGAKILTDQPSK